MAKGFKITRDSMLYMEHTESSYGAKEDFAQCKTCVLFTGDERERCYVLGQELEVTGADTCGGYWNGPPTPEFAGKEYVSATPEEAGFEKRAVRCENCYWYTGVGICGLFAKLNLEYPEIFDLNPMVSKFGCCDSNTPIDTTFEKENIIMFLNKKIDLKKLFSK